ncbi:MAG TPA: hypothetical protein VD865_16685 [Stenotrophomonas sp.]|nr:hypothetical protein [Stenotrophomonas sp.]
MSIFNDLLFAHGYIANEDLARRLADSPAPPTGEPPRTGATHPHPHPRAQVRARQARMVRIVTALSPFR